MTRHNMKLQNKFFDYIKNGTKRIELRLYDPKRQTIALGDQIEFTNQVGESITANVIGLLRYQTFAQLFNDFDISILADQRMTKAELLATLEEFYSSEKQAEYGVIGIRLQMD